MRIIHSERTDHFQGEEDIEAARLEAQANGLTAHVLRQVRAGHIGEPILTRTSRLLPFPKELSETTVGIADQMLAEANLTITAHERVRKIIIPGFITLAQDTVTVERTPYPETPLLAGPE
jgi:hypothetical protein